MGTISQTVVGIFGWRQQSMQNMIRVAVYQTEKTTNFHLLLNITLQNYSRKEGDSQIARLSL